MVVSAAERYGFSCRQLVWEGPRPQTNIEAAARTARYRLLVEAARALEADHLVLAHHRDDVAEGLLLRLARGAGVFGLAAMRPAIDLDGLVVARPLLSVPRARLAATARAAGLSPVDDPMNRDQRFARARVRSAMPDLAPLGLDPGGLASAAVRLTDAADAIDVAATALIDEAVTFDDLGLATLSRSRFQTAAAAVRLRAVERLLSAVGGGQAAPRFERLSAIVDAIAGGGTWRRTLAGVVVSSRGGEAKLWRERGRLGLPWQPLEPGVALWDRRFEVTTGDQSPPGARLAALGDTGRRAIGARGGAAGVLGALPAVWIDDTVVAVPSIGYPEAGSGWVTVRCVVGERARRPRLFPEL